MVTVKRRAQIVVVLCMVNDTLNSLRGLFAITRSKAARDAAVFAAAPTVRAHRRRVTAAMRTMGSGSFIP
jgi:hypothetical protein